MNHKRYALIENSYLVPFLLVSTLFFVWGFARSILGVFNSHFADSLHMNGTETFLTQIIVYVAYFVVGLPSGLYLQKKGYKQGIVSGLLIFAIGSLLLVPGEMMLSIPMFFGALFVVGSGLVLIETSASPYVTMIGSRQTSASRLNLSQSLYGMGCLLGPTVFGSILYAEGINGHLEIPCIFLGLTVLIITILFSLIKLPEKFVSSIQHSNIADMHKMSAEMFSAKGSLSSKLFILGVVALLFYEISEIFINQTLIMYVNDNPMIENIDGSLILSVGALALFTVGRLLGAVVMCLVPAELVLLISSVLVVFSNIGMLTNFDALGHICLLLCYFFESIMFPTIFAFSLRHAGPRAKIASGILMMTPIGGAIGVSLLNFSSHLLIGNIMYIIPMVGFLVVLAYAVVAYRNCIKRQKENDG